LLAYKNEDKFWEWIFGKFPGRTPAAVHTLDHGIAQSQMSFLLQWTGSSSSSVCLLVPRPLLGRISDEDLILLSASPNAGARTVEGSGVKDQMHGWVEYHKENREVDIGSR
jgi:hypothetical protein